MFIQEPRHNKIINKLAELADIYRHEIIRALNDIFFTSLVVSHFVSVI